MQMVRENIFDKIIISSGIDENKQDYLNNLLYIILYKNYTVGLDLWYR